MGLNSRGLNLPTNTRRTNYLLIFFAARIPYAKRSKAASRWLHFRNRGRPTALASPANESPFSCIISVDHRYGSLNAPRFTDGRATIKIGGVGGNRTTHRISPCFRRPRHRDHTGDRQTFSGHPCGRSYSLSN